MYPTTAAGKFQFTVMAGVAERDLIVQRTRDALKARADRLGRPVTMPAAVRARVGELRKSGLSIGEVADALNAEGVQRAGGALAR